MIISSTPNTKHDSVALFIVPRIELTISENLVLDKMTLCLSVMIYSHLSIASMFIFSILETKIKIHFFFLSGEPTSFKGNKSEQVSISNTCGIPSLSDRIRSTLSACKIKSHNRIAVSHIHSRKEFSRSNLQQ